LNASKTIEDDLKCFRSVNPLPKTVSSEALLGQGRQMFITHDGQMYQLRITKLGKLILTK
jgi:hemin uptake protein HemP